MYTFSIYLRLLRAQLRSQFQYRASFWLDVFTTAVFSGVYFLSFALLLERFGQIDGWRLGEIAFLAGMTELTFALMDLIFSGFDPDFFAPNVQMGRLDQIFLRPVSITVQLLGSRLVLRRLGRALEGLVILLFGIFASGMHWTLAKVLYLPILMVSQIFCMGALFIAGSTITFWTIQRVEAVNIVTYGGVEMMSYPMSIYPAWIRRFFTYVLPFIFMNYYPALFFLDKPDPLNMPAFAPFLAPFVAAILFWLALRFWRFGLNHYQSTGS